MSKLKIIIGVLAALLIGSLAFIGINQFAANNDGNSTSSEAEISSEVQDRKRQGMNQNNKQIEEWEHHIAHADNLIGLTDTDKANMWVSVSRWLDNNGYDSATTVLDCAEPVTLTEAHEGVQAIVAKLDIVGRDNEAILAQFETGVWSVSKWLDPNAEVEPEPKPVEEEPKKEENSTNTNNSNATPAQPTEQQQQAMAGQDQHGEFNSAETQFDVKTAWPLTKTDKVDAIIGSDIRERLLNDLKEQFETVGITIKRPDDVLVSEQDMSKDGSALYFRICVLSGNDRIVTDCAYDTESMDHEYQILP